MFGANNRHEFQILGLNLGREIENISHLVF
jgi:hypothetical protein